MKACATSQATLVLLASIVCLTTVARCTPIRSWLLAGTADAAALLEYKLLRDELRRELQQNQVTMPRNSQVTSHRNVGDQVTPLEKRNLAWTAMGGPLPMGGRYAANGGDANGGNSKVLRYG